MKKVVITGLILVLLLAGCSNNPNEVRKEVSLIEWSFFASDQYDESKGLNIYTNSGDPYLPYVNISDFLRYIGNSASIRINGDIFECDTSISGEDKSIKFDASQNTLTIFDDTDFYGKGVLSMGQGEVSLLSPAKEVSIDLSKYGFEFIEKEGEFYLPFDVANIVLSERRNLSLYNQEIVTIWLFGTSSLKLVPDRLNDVEKEEFKLYKDRYLNLIGFHLDNFFGYNDYLEVDDFYEDMMKTSLKRANNYFDYQVALSNYFLDFEDNHTWNHSNKQFEDNLKFEIRILLSNLMKLFSEANEERLFLCTSERQEIEVIDNIAYVKINSFNTSEVFGLMNDLIELEGISHVVFDVSCNSGGKLNQGLSILKYIANKPVDIFFKNTLSGKVEKHTYKPLEDFYLDKEFYFVSSNVSYSTTNILLNVVKMNELGTIIGKPTSGGACTTRTILLSGTNYYNHSTHFCYTDRDMNIIEDGVEPDIYYEPKSDSDIVSDVVEIIYDLS